MYSLFSGKKIDKLWGKVIKKKTIVLLGYRQLISIYYENIRTVNKD